jgi:hypothetical protein
MSGAPAKKVDPPRRIGVSSAILGFILLISLWEY